MYRSLQDQTQKFPEPLEYEPDIVTDGGEHGVGVITVASLEEVAAEMAVGSRASRTRCMIRALMRRPFHRQP